MIAKSIVLIVLVTFANFVSPRTRRHFRPKHQQQPRYRNLGYQSMYADRRFYTDSCRFKKSNIKSDTTSNIKTDFNPDNQIILPPRGIELPFGLGYSFAAIPTVAETFNANMFGPTKVRVSEDFIPVSPEFASMKIATPFSNEWGSLVKSVVL